MQQPLEVGRYMLWRELAAGGMASVYLGRMFGDAGFGKTVAIKRMHPHFAKDEEFVTMFLDEARVTAGLTHPNIVLTLDVIEAPSGLFLVMEYVHGASLSMLLKALAKTKDRAVPPAIAAAVVAGALHGLHAAHEARSDTGEPLMLVHRDVSPHNILVTVDGTPKIADFGIAKAAGQIHSTSEGVIKGKHSYMAPEQARGEPITPQADVFSAGIVLWEALTGARLVNGASSAERIYAILNLKPVAPSQYAEGIPRSLDAVVLRALAPRPADRFPSARAMAMAIEEAINVASAATVGEWVRATLGDALVKREEMLKEMKRWARTVADAPPPPFREPTASSPFLPSTIGSEDLVTSKSDTAGAAASSRSAPPRALPSRPRGPWTTILVLVGSSVLACIGVVLITIARSHGRAAPALAAAQSAEEPPRGPPASAAATALVPSQIEPPSTASAQPPDPPTAARAPDDGDGLDPPPDPSANTKRSPQPAAAKASGQRPAGKASCKIVATPGANGRMTFREVCP